jgi:hypothetical protein
LLRRLGPQRHRLTEPLRRLEPQRRRLTDCCGGWDLNGTGSRTIAAAGTSTAPADGFTATARHKRPRLRDLPAGLELPGSGLTD